MSMLRNFQSSMCSALVEARLTILLPAEAVNQVRVGCFGHLRALWIQKQGYADILACSIWQTFHECKVMSFRTEGSTSIHAIFLQKQTFFCVLYLQPWATRIRMPMPLVVATTAPSKQTPTACAATVRKVRTARTAQRRSCDLLRIWCYRRVRAFASPSSTSPIPSWEAVSPSIVGAVSGFSLVANCTREFSIGLEAPLGSGPLVSTLCFKRATLGVPSSHRATARATQTPRQTKQGTPGIRRTESPRGVRCCKNCTQSDPTHLQRRHQATVCQTRPAPQRKLYASTTSA